MAEERFPINLKSTPNRREYIRILQRMTPEQRVQKALELTEMCRSVFREGLRQRFPEKSEAELHQIYLQRLAKCHNQNY